MTDKKISQLPAATAPDGSEKVAVVQGGTTKRLTLAEIIELIGQLPTMEPETPGLPWVDPDADYVVKVSQA